MALIAPRGFREHFLRLLVAALALAGVGLLGSACGVSNAVQAPLNILPESDVVVETNLTTAETVGELGGMAGSGFATTSGPSTSYGVISVSSGPGRPSVYAGFNQLSDDCLGLIVVPSGSLPALGEGLAGTYYFWVLKTTSNACDATTFAETPSLPPTWPKGDPTTAGWPKPT